MTDVVYCVRPGTPTQPETLRYSLRSLANLHHSQVFIVGHKPDWVSDHVIHIPTVQWDPNGDGKFHNIGINLEAAINDVRVSEDFYWFNDDFFIMQETTDIPIYARPVTAGQYKANLKLTADPDQNAFTWGIWTQCDMIERIGFRLNEVPLADCHYPMPLNKEEVWDTIYWMRANYPTHPIGHFRGIHAMLHGYGEQILMVPDCKVALDSHGLLPGAKFASTYQTSWNGKAGREIRNRFWSMSKYEDYDG